MSRTPIPLHVPGFEATVEGTREAIHAFMQSMEVFLTGQALLRTENGNIGFGPAGLAVGDVIAVICGTRMPLVLRKQTRQREGILRFIGFKGALVSVSDGF
jgi:hypothetical protein